MESDLVLSVRCDASGVLSHTMDQDVVMGSTQSGEVAAVGFLSRFGIYIAVWKRSRLYGFLARVTNGDGRGTSSSKDLADQQFSTRT